MITDKLSRYSQDLKNEIWADVNNPIFEKYYNELLKVADKMIDKCAEHECNCPDSDALIDRWEDRQYQLEEAVEQIQDICDDFYEIMTRLSNISEENMIYWSNRLDMLIDNMVEYQQQYHGLSCIKE